MKAANRGFVIIIFCLIACTTIENRKNLDEGWVEMNRVSKQVKNIKYIFPSDVSLVLRDSAIRMNEVAINENLELIKENTFTDSIKFEFFHTRAAMKLTCGYGTKGLAMPRQNAMYSLLDLSERSPIQHEMMHIILSKKWGNGYASMQWFNEGLATYAGSICGNKDFAKVYAYMLQNNHLIAIDKLVDDFYGQDEVVGYTQGAYIVHYLSTTYGWSKLKELWQGGFSQFKSVFGKPYELVEKEMHQQLNGTFPNPVELDWEQFKKGCPN